MTVGPSQTIASITGTGSPYTIELVGAPDISLNYTVANNATLSDRHGLGFIGNIYTGVDGYKYYTGLLREVQWQIDGKDSDPVNYPGIKAAGTHIEAKAAAVKLIDVVLDIVPSPGTALTDISNDIKSVIAAYINGRGVGNDIILSEIVAAVHSINNIDDVFITYPTANIVVADNEVARTDETRISLG